MGVGRVGVEAVSVSSLVLAVVLVVGVYRYPFVGCGGTLCHLYLWLWWWWLLLLLVVDPPLVCFSTVKMLHMKKVAPPRLLRNSLVNMLNHQKNLLFYVLLSS